MTESASMNTGCNPQKGIPLVQARQRKRAGLALLFLEHEQGGDAGFASTGASRIADQHVIPRTLVLVDHRFMVVRSQAHSVFHFRVHVW